MKSQVRIYTVDEANALVPTVRPLVDRQRACMATLEHAVALLKASETASGSRRTSAHPSAPTLRIASSDAPTTAQHKRRVRELTDELRGYMLTLEALGVFVCDVHAGRVEVYAEHDGDVVWLAWQPGQASFTQWRPLDAPADAWQPLESARVARTFS